MLHEVTNGVELVRRSAAQHDVTGERALDRDSDAGDVLHEPRVVSDMRTVADAPQTRCAERGGDARGGKLASVDSDTESFGCRTLRPPVGGVPQPGVTGCVIGPDQQIDSGESVTRGA